ncbi:hypothetical protein LGL55_24000 [Clostridium tagluense]|uniref:hypothetical protein n=1 Tax=Clostridium tagluense TaxID=360422 RepID=UPI001CF2CB7F|nr:hypothetical protein [Clostridium tagluense]MCB2314110.1 hypothetical protein [Clostridium tagluense]MCB2318831.1 hypothetical protein [Clostridium tagluense]MCB2323841.1 hypothetical protein [Clostridium tagluense]MCB2328668.1 hypothetical protein [Clostridium tagluense]MCB2333552.1 hypothetical protein [Clostridium tagluense]
MIKVINPLFRKEESTDSAYFNCACICYKESQISETKSGSWAPFTGGCYYSCDSAIAGNLTGNKNTSHSA